MRIIIFTDKYPYGQYEETFVANEVAFLAAHYRASDVVIVPLKGEVARREMPSGVEVMLPVLHRRGSGAWLRLLARLLLRGSFWLFFRETLWALLRGVKLRSVWFTRYVAAELVALNAQRIMAEGPPGVLYSYWMSYGALGIAIARHRAGNHKAWRCVCRAHAYDIREARGGIPLRGFTWRWIDKVFPVSAAGAAELLRQRGAQREKVQVAYLGVQGLAGPAKVAGNDGRVLFVSCSGARPVKRLELMLRMVEAYAAEVSPRRVEWVHFGDGELLKNLQEAGRGAEARRSNLHLFWRGGVANETVLREYEELCGAIFLNTSAREGLPVAIMEALSAGFPVVATDVGGTAEALEGGAGELLDAEPSEQSFINAVGNVLADYGRYSRCARAAFEERFSAERNYKRFYSNLFEPLA